MNKKILLLAFFGLLTGTLFAQKFHFGLGVTPSMAWLHSGTDDFEGDGSKVGFNYGLITEFAITENYSFATGITFENNGGKLKTKGVTVDTLNYHLDFKLQYVEVPLTLKMKTKPVGYIRYYGQFGVAPAFLIGAKGTTEQGSTIIADDVDVKDDINNFNISLVIGGGIEYNLSGTTNLLLGIVYKNGFSDVLNTDSKANANSLGLNIGVLF
jgi:opacity protein-like surface antigen